MSYHATAMAGFLLGVVVTALAFHVLIENFG